MCHQNADPDSVYSAHAFSRLLKKLIPDSKVEITCDGVSKLSKKLLKYVPVELNIDSRFEKADVLIIIDANNLEQIGKLREKVVDSNLPIVILDHHTPPAEGRIPIEVEIVDENARSTCEIIYELYKEAGVEVDGDVAQAIFLGIAFDTRLFRYASSNTFLVVSDLVRHGLRVEDALGHFSIEMENPERIARIKSSVRAKTLLLNRWIIGISHVSSYQASAARGLLSLGYHLSVVCGEKAGRVQISFRCTREFHEKTGIHLARDLAEPLGKLLKGAGGGHSTSAGVNGYGSLEEVLKLCEVVLREKLTTHF
ncbi:MAG: DHH family phosphoesterase [Candidatus Bathyarchaeia archaeon]